MKPDAVAIPGNAGFEQPVVSRAALRAGEIDPLVIDDSAPPGTSETMAAEAGPGVRARGFQDMFADRYLFDGALPDALRYGRRRRPGEPRRRAERTRPANEGMDPGRGLDSSDHSIVFGKEDVTLPALIFQERNSKSISVSNSRGGL